MPCYYSGLAALQPHMGVPAPATGAAAPAAASSNDGGSEAMDTEDGASASGALSAAIVENIEKTAATYVADGWRFWGVACRA